ncbi:MAG: glutamine amidotransferase [Anaerolineae bacterium]|nr:glutamine amidotransferase [Anaerolineae bacterium]
MNRLLLIIKTGSSIPSLVVRRGDFEDWIAQGLGLSRAAITVVDVTKAEKLPSPDGVRGVVISGSHAMVTERQAWSEHTAEWLGSAVKAGIPILGICYGHQLLAYALGGEVGDNPNGREFGTVDIHLLADGAADGGALFAGLSTPIQVHVSHTQSVLKLPEGAQVLATSAMEPHAAIAFAPRVWGVQFHPEFDADIVRTYTHTCADILHSEGQDPEQRLATCRDTLVGAALLRQFARLATQSVQPSFVYDNSSD